MALRLYQKLWTTKIDKTSITATTIGDCVVISGESFPETTYLSAWEKGRQGTHSQARMSPRKPQLG